MTAPTPTEIRQRDWDGFVQLVMDLEHKALDRDWSRGLDPRAINSNRY
jgi:hypothetical protein